MPLGELFCNDSMANTDYDDHHDRHRNVNGNDRPYKRIYECGHQHSTLSNVDPKNKTKQFFNKMKYKS